MKRLTVLANDSVCVLQPISEERRYLQRTDASESTNRNEP